MKAALLFGVKDLRLVEIPKPVCEANGILVRVSACGVCPTDIRKYLTLDNGTLTLPMNLGHEWAGVIEEVGVKVTGFRPGMRIIGDTYAGYAEYASINAESLKMSFPNGPLSIPPHVSDEELTFVEPLADCLHAILDQANITAGHTVVILGGGPMGALLTSVATLYGAQVIVSEPLPERRELVRSFGACATVDPISQEIVNYVLDATRGAGVQAVIVSVGIPSLINSALQMLTNRGRVVLFAGFPRPTWAEIDPNLIHYKELVITGSEWIGVPSYLRPELYQTAVDLIAEGKVPVKKLISACYPFYRIREAFEVAQSPSSLKVIIKRGEVNM